MADKKWKDKLRWPTLVSELRLALPVLAEIKISGFLLYGHGMPCPAADPRLEAW